MKKANPAQLCNFLWNEKNKFPLTAIKGSVVKGFRVDDTELFPWLMKLQSWLLDFNKSECPGVEMISEERQEQIEKHGWTLEHDFSCHTHDELIRAACAIAFVSKTDKPANFSAPDWALEIRERIEHDRLHCYKVAGGLIAAAIDLLLSSPTTLSGNQKGGDTQ